MEKLLEQKKLNDFFSFVRDDREIRNLFIKSLILTSHLDGRQNEEASLLMIINNYFLKLDEIGYQDLQTIHVSIQGDKNPGIKTALNTFSELYSKLPDDRMRKIYYLLVYSLILSDTRVGPREMKFLKKINFQFKIHYSYDTFLEAKEYLLHITEVGFKKFKIPGNWKMTYQNI